MNHFLFPILFLIMFQFTGIAVEGQNVFVLERAGHGKIHMFNANDKIKLSTRSTGLKYEGTISTIYDSSLVIKGETEIMLDDIAAIYRERWGFKLLQTVCLASGLLYLSVSALNGVINADDPIVPEQTLKISGGLVAAGVVLSPLTTRTHTIKPTRWKVKILDFTYE
jgi:hypothetical protein